MEEYRIVAVSPRHQVRLSGEYLPMLKWAPERDFVVHTLEKREANGLPLMSAEIVIASFATRKQHPLATTYPLHFRKTSFATRLHGDASDEFEHCSVASQLIGLPPPIGFSGNVFRSCLIPGSNYRRHTPFDSDSEDTNLRKVDSLSIATAAGLWRLAEDAERQLTTLHAGGLAHGDAELQNFIVCPAPLEILLIDFETSVQREEVDEQAWQARCAADFAPLLREALFLQAALGRQRGPLAERSWAAAPQLVRDAERIRSRIERVGNLQAAD